VINAILFFLGRPRFFINGCSADRIKGSDIFPPVVCYHYIEENININKKASISAGF
jgi:hypothetical protein